MRNWKTGASTALLCAALLTGCGDSRLNKFTVGIAPDSVTKLMGGDSAHTVASYLVKGKKWDVRFYARSKAAATDSIPWRTMSPVVLVDGKVVSWGWASLDKDATILGLSFPK